MLRDVIKPVISSVISDMLGSVSVLALFAAGEIGLWFDTTDITTLYQDINGTTPVTAPGQTCALMLDKSKGLALGPELVTNGGFDTSDGWTLGANTTIADGVASFNYTSFAGMVTGVGVSVVAGKTYRVTYTLLSRISGSIRAQVGGTPENGKTTPGTYTTLLVAANTSANGLIFVGDGNGFVGTIDNVSVRELAGNHATQPTAAQRPTYGVIPYGGVRNLLTYSEQFDNAIWTKTGVTVTSNATTAPDGTLTADLMTGGGNWFAQTSQIVGVANQQIYAKIWVKGATGVTTCTIRVDRVGSAQGNQTAKAISDTSWALITHNVTLDGGTGSPVIRLDLLGGDIYVWGAQLELGSTTTAYQKVVSKYEVTEAGKASLGVLYPDGIDDWMVTPSINFSGTDKVTIWAGLQKMSDAAAGMLAELSSNAALVGNTGSFYLSAPNLSLASDRYGFFSRGSALAVLGQTSLVSTGPAPDVAILTALGDISSDVSSLSRNGAAGTNGAADQGTGNYGNYPLYLFRRGGTSLPYNGIFTGMIVRGAASTPSQIKDGNTHINSKLGAY